MSEFRSFVAEKELEWKSALNQQIALLEESLASREAELREERKQAAQLKEDFKYNIKLVKERDEELASLERESIVMKQQCLALEEKLSAMSVKHDEVSQRLQEEAYANGKLADQWKSAQDSRERELQLLRHEHELEASRMRDEQQALRRQLEMENVRCRKELEVQRRELTGAFDRRAEELQADYHARTLQLEKALMDCELKCDLLDKDNASVQKARLELLGRLETCEGDAAALEKQLTETTARYQSDIAVLENEQERLQELVASLETNHRAAVARLEEKLAGVQQDAGRKEALLADGASKAKAERLAVRQQTSDLLARLHEAEASFQRKATEFEATLRSKDEAVGKLEAQVEELQVQLHASKANVGRLFADKDAEIDRLQRQAQSTAEELRNRQADIERYKREAETALAREAEFEARRQQLDVDYQRRVGELETLQYEKSETYIERLTQARNDALSEAEELRATLAQKQTFIQSLLKDREAALQAMREHGVSLDRRMESKAVERDLLADSEQRAKDLALQNETLKEIVKQMRQEMEALNPAAAGSHKPPPHQAAAAAASSIGDIKSIQELSNVLAKLRNEKTDLLAQCRKQQARIGHLETRLSEVDGEKAGADTVAEQLRYQLSAQERHHATEVAGMKRRLHELEAQLDESQREADEYYKANIEKSKLAEQLQHEVLLLKSNQARSAKPGEVNFGAQELYIQQLQNEIERLRDRMQARQLYADDDEEEDDASRDKQSGSQVRQLKTKLKMAANQIKKLAQENQALVDLSNRLRAELKQKHHGGNAAASARAPASYQRQHQRQPIELESHARRAVKDAVGGMTSKLRELEQMQYYLTREELARRNAAEQSSARAAAVGIADSDQTLADSLPVKDTGGPPVRRAEGLLAAASKASLAVSSSVGGNDQSLREVWQLLDTAAPLPDTARGDATQAAGAAVGGSSLSTRRNQALSSLRVRGLPAPGAGAGASGADASGASTRPQQWH